MKTESNFKFDANGIEVTIVKKNYTLEDLRQKLINYFYNKKLCYLDSNETEILKTLIANKDITKKADLEMFDGYINGVTKVFTNDIEVNKK